MIHSADCRTWLRGGKDVALHVSRGSTGRGRWPLASIVCLALAMAGCWPDRPGSKSRSKQPESAIRVKVEANQPIVVESRGARFEILRSGYVHGALVEKGRTVTIDEPSPSNAGGYVVLDGKEIRDFRFNLEKATLSKATRNLGVGRRIGLTGVSSEAPFLQATLSVEVFDEFPSLAISTTLYKNVGPTPVALNRVVAQAQRLNAAQTNPASQPYQMWSFHGSSEKWGKDDVMEISKGFVRENPFQKVMFNRPGDPITGGGIPVVALWTAAAGEAIGHIETLPVPLSVPVRTGEDGRVSASVVLEPGATLQSGETYATPATFVALYHGDFYEALRLYSLALQREGWMPAKPSDSSYAANWCGWGYELNVTPQQMLGTIPKLKELGLTWATLDAGWYNNQGDWQPRQATFPGDTIKKLVDRFHQEGIRITLWWIPIVVEDGQGRSVLDGHSFALADVVRSHPDWLILDKDGKRATMAGYMKGLCPALPEVQQYYRQLTERFIRDWGLDGHKLDFSYTVPPCYNPRHEHRSPEDSVRAVADVYNIIFETTRALKPDSVTQICPCGTPPNLAWVPAMDQAVTADPVGAVQVRRRIKMYKALLGPEAAVYGDHVELTKMVDLESREPKEIGQDFASTVGTGGVVGTKFTWPDYGPKFQRVYLTTEKEKLWKKWITLYNEKMLSRGKFRNLYTLGYDDPEGYAIEKDGEMYYAFFAREQSPEWKGDLTLRGLGPGKYDVRDYETGRVFGPIDGAHPVLPVEFTDHLLLEAIKQ